MRLNFHPEGTLEAFPHPLQARANGSTRSCFGRRALFRRLRSLERYMGRQPCDHRHIHQDIEGEQVNAATRQIGHAWLREWNPGGMAEFPLHRWRTRWPPGVVDVLFTLLPSRFTTVGSGLIAPSGLVAGWCEWRAEAAPYTATPRTSEPAPTPQGADLSRHR